MRSAAGCALALLASATAWSSEVERPVLSVLEVGDAGGPFAQMRYAFFSSHLGWQGFDVHSARRWQSATAAEWQFVLDGKRVGALTLPGLDVDGLTQDTDQFVQRLSAEAADVPYIDPGSLPIAYRHWQVTARPLLATSGSHIADPEGWQPAELTTREWRMARDAFRSAYPVLNGYCPGSAMPGGFLNYPDDAITLLAVYRSQDGHLLVEQTLDATKTPCNVTTGSSPGGTWLALDPDGSALRVGGGLVPLGVADFDGDDRSEWVFKSSNCCSDGYVLFYDGFSRNAWATWK